MLHTEECRGSYDLVPLVKDLMLPGNKNGNYLNFIQVNHGSAFGYYSDKSPLSWLTNFRLTWVLKCLYSSPPSWFNDELGAHGTPLVNAVFRDDLEMVSYLVDVGVDINKPCNQHVIVPGTFPLFIATTHGHLRSFNLLLDCGANPQQQHTFLHSTAMHEACAQACMPIVIELARRGLDVNQRNRNGLTPLQLAIQAGSLDITRFLVEEAGAKVLMKTASGTAKTALHYAIELRSTPITGYLLGHRQDFDFGCLRDLTIDQIKWAAEEPWYPQLRFDIASEGEGKVNCETRSLTKSLTWLDVIQTFYVLHRHLGFPRHVTAMTLDYAGYWARSTVRRDEFMVVDQNTPERPYISILVKGLGVSPVRRIILRTRSHDQGELLYPRA
jgi:ankyrin repeat protein